jgi:hypothetical protein
MGMTPASVREVSTRGQEVLVQSGAEEGWVFPMPIITEWAHRLFAGTFDA